MDIIIGYLQNPMKVGVYNEKFTVDFSGLRNYLKGLMRKQKKIEPKDILMATENGYRFVSEYEPAQLGKTLEQLTEKAGDETCFETISKALHDCAALLKKFPEDASSLFFDKSAMPIGPSILVERRPTPVFFGSHIIPKVNDVCTVEKERISRYNWLFDVVTIKGSTDIPLHKLLEAIPPLRKGTEVLKKKRHFSTRYTFRPYALATQLWLEDNTSIGIPSDLRSFLQGAIRYFASNEWRTSIVLCAISVESMLADLYEESFKEAAPDVPLGDLFGQVKKKVEFPLEIANAIDLTNKARIAAVHRSRFPVSDKEAINALYGAVNFTLWYSS